MIHSATQSPLAHALLGTPSPGQCSPLALREGESVCRRPGTRDEEEPTVLNVKKMCIYKYNIHMRVCCYGCVFLSAGKTCVCKYHRPHSVYTCRGVKVHACMRVCVCVCACVCVSLSVCLLVHSRDCVCVSMCVFL